MNDLKMRILDQLLSHLENLDSEDLKPKPKALGIEVTSIGKPEEMEVDRKDDTSSDKGPMEKLMDSKMDDDSDGDVDSKDDDELSDEDLADLIKAHLK